MQLLVLPGLDGTARLLPPFIAALPPYFRARTFEYPPDRVLSYDALLKEIPLPDAPFAIIAESFGGPLALKLAATHPAGLLAVVLVATFIRCPVRVPRFLATLVRPSLLAGAPPAWLIRRNLVGREASASLVQEVQAATRVPHRDVLANRLREVIRVEAAEALRTCPVPVFYLAGGQDRLVGRFNMEAMLAVRASMVCRVIDAPHLVLQVEPTRSAVQIGEWLSEPRRAV